jgi:hypothetical protein
MLLLLLLLLLGVSGYVQKRKTELGFYKQDNACQSDSESSISAGAASPPREPEEGPVPAAERNDEGGLLDDTVATSVQVSEARAAGEKQRGERAAATVKLWHSCKQADAVAAAGALAQGADASAADEVFPSAQPRSDLANQTSDHLTCSHVYTPAPRPALSPPSHSARRRS